MNSKMFTMAFAIFVCSAFDVVSDDGSPQVDLPDNFLPEEMAIAPPTEIMPTENQNDEVAFIFRSKSKEPVATTPTISQDNKAVETQQPPYPSMKDQNPGFFFSGEFLYWKANIEGLLLAYTKDFPITPVGFPAEDELVGDVHQINYPWASGYRTAAGYKFERDFWQLKGEYTFFHTSNSEHVSLPPGPDGALAGTLSYFTEGAFIARMRHHADFRYHIGDLLLERMINFSEQIKMTFFTGARGAYIAQKWKARVIANNGTFSHHDIKWAFKGGGMRFGVSADWLFGQGMAFFSNGSFSALAGDYDNTYKQITSRSTPGIVNDVDFGDTRMIFGGQFASGISWCCNFKKKNVLQSLRLYAAFEFNTWFNLNEFHQLADMEVASHSPSGQKPTMYRTTPVNLMGLVAGSCLRF